jgi:hypothetical protein
MKIHKENFIKVALFTPVFFKAIQKLLEIEFKLFSNYLLNILVSFLVFLFVKNMSTGFRNLLGLEVNSTSSLALMFLFLFSIASILSVFNLEVQFKYFTIFFVLLFNVYFFRNKMRFINRLTQILITLFLVIFNKFSWNTNQLFVQNRIEVSGDINAHLLPITKQIFENNLLNVFSEPIDIGENIYILTSTLGNFYFAFFSKILLMDQSFLHYKFLPYTTFWIFCLLCFELNFDKFTKILFFAVNISVFIINDWITYQFFNSYLNEGISIIFFSTIFLNFNKMIFQNKSKFRLILTLISFMCFSKLFISLLIFLIPVVYLKKTKLKIVNLTPLVTGPILMLLLFTVNGIGRKNIISNQKVELSLFNKILNYWLEDLNLVYFIILFLILLFLNILNLEDDLKIVLLFNLVNFTLIFSLYIFFWGLNYEYESSYRYFLQMYFINIISLFKLSPFSQLNKI